MKLREQINRKVTYSIVTIYTKDKTIHYVVYGKTTKQKELLKYLKENVNSDIPTIEVKTKTERRTMTIENFIKNSILINGSEENK